MGNQASRRDVNSAVAASSHRRASDVSHLHHDRRAHRGLITQPSQDDSIISNEPGSASHRTPRDSTSPFGTFDEEHPVEINPNRKRANTMDVGILQPGKKFDIPTGTGQGDNLPVVIRWKGGGKQIYLAGTFNGWKGKIPMVKSTSDFMAIVDLPPGERIADEIVFHFSRAIRPDRNCSCGFIYEFSLTTDPD